MKRVADVVQCVAQEGQHRRIVEVLVRRIANLPFPGLLDFLQQTVQPSLDFRLR